MLSTSFATNHFASYPFPFKFGNWGNFNSSPKFDFEIVWCAAGSCSDIPPYTQGVSFSIRAHDPPNTITNLTPSQINALKQGTINALKIALKIAFAPYNVSVGTGHNATNTVYVIGNDISDCGLTDSVKTLFIWGVYPPHADEAQVVTGSTGANPSLTQLQQLLPAIAEGIGNTAAHEIAHELVTLFSRYPGKIVSCMDMQDNVAFPGTYATTPHSLPGSERTATPVSIGTQMQIRAWQIFSAEKLHLETSYQSTSTRMSLFLKHYAGPETAS